MIIGVFLELLCLDLARFGEGLQVFDHLILMKTKGFRNVTDRDGSPFAEIEFRADVIFDYGDFMFMK